MVGVNLLREGLDLPEVTLVAILDADKEGFLRSEASLIQTMVVPRVTLMARWCYMPMKSPVPFVALLPRPIVVATYNLPTIYNTTSHQNHSESDQRYHGRHEQKEDKKVKRCELEQLPMSVLLMSLSKKKSFKCAKP